jgi:histidyl-tRNA synthetase
MSSPAFRAPKGMPDLLGDSLADLVRLEEAAARLFRLHGFRRIRTPLLEERNLYARSTGETSEVVEKQMFVVRREKADYALRPEGTPSVVRAYLQASLHKRAPFQKLWYSGPMFRHERMQRARQRQFHQVGVESLGTDDPMRDAEVVALGARFFETIGLEGVEVVLNTLGDAACRPAFRQALRTYQSEHEGELCDACRGRMTENPLRFLDCKSSGCKALRAGAPRLEPCEACAAHFAEVRRLLDTAEVPVVVDPTLVRGLDYYTRTAFEYRYSPLGARDAVGGGGRYDGLAEQIGGPPTPGIGFAIGVEATLVALETAGVAASGDTTVLDLFIIPVPHSGPGVDDAGRVFVTAQACRRAGLATEIGQRGRSVKSQMRAADAARARYTVVLGETEFRDGQCKLREMATGEEREIAVDDLPMQLYQ